MNKQFLLSVVVISSMLVQTTFAPSLYAQNNELNFVDAGGKRQGYWKIVAAIKKLGAPWSPNQVVEEGTYLNSLQDGVWLSYFQSGTKRSEVSYKTGKRFGMTRYFSENGQILSASEYENDLLNGVRTVFYPDGQPLMESHWNYGEMIGTVRTYYPSGKLYEEGTWANGWFIGDYTIYNEDGSVKRVALPPITQ